ncbi:MAG: thiamine-phosphate kinase [Cyanobacteria bacterium P01_F01_bin.33]
MSDSRPSRLDSIDPDKTASVGAVGERGLLEIVQSFCLPNVVGDDAAVLDAPNGKLVVTTDVLVEGVHFSDRTTPPHAVGWRAAAANLSDLAAMGAEPLGLTVGLSLPGTTSVPWVRGLYAGLAACCQPWGVGMVGGDITRANQRFVAITAWGQIESERAMWRSAARPGDWLLATGPHGSSRGGLELLLYPELAQSLSATEREYLEAAHQYPQPRLDVLPVLPDLWSLTGRVGGMDTSDGLADAIAQVCAASGVGAAIEPDWIPIHPAIRSAFPDRALEWALYGGEDFELLLSLPEVGARRAIAQLPGTRRIGTVVETRTIALSDGRTIGPDLAFQHFGTVL